MKREEVFEIIKEILSREFGADPDKVTKTTRINIDVGIEGDDADDFFDLLERRTGKSVSINLQDYFMGESLFARPKKNALTINMVLDSLNLLQ